MRAVRHTRFDCNPGCSIEATLSIIDGKWKGVLLYHLLDGAVRFNELRRRVPCVTQRMLTTQLRELETDGLVTRTVHAQVPARVEYGISALGRTLEPVLRAMGAWGESNRARFATGTSPQVSQKATQPSDTERTRRLTAANRPDDRRAR